MTAKQKPRQAGNLRTAPKKHKRKALFFQERLARVRGWEAQKRIDTAHSTSSNDPLAGWFSLAAGVKPSRNRPPKRGWRKGWRA